MNIRLIEKVQGLRALIGKGIKREIEGERERERVTEGEREKMKEEGVLLWLLLFFSISGLRCIRLKFFFIQKSK